MTDDRIGILVDWIDNYRNGDLAALLATYESDAIIDCRCIGATLRTHEDIGKYWRERMAKDRSANILDLKPHGDTIVLVYSIGAQTIEASFEFGRNGLIAASHCGPVSACVASAEQTN